MTDSTKKTDRTRPPIDTSALTGARAQTFRTLTEHPGSSTAVIAVAAGLGRSTVGKALATLESQGIAIREKGDNTPGKATPDTWYPHPDTAPGQVHPLPSQGTDPKPDTTAPETANAEEEGSTTTSADSRQQDDESEAHTSTDTETGAPHPADPDHEVQPDEHTDPAPQQEQPVHDPASDAEQEDTPLGEHHGPASLDAQPPAPPSGGSAPVQQEAQPPTAQDATASGPLPVAADKPPAEVTRPEPGKQCPTCGHWRPSDTHTDNGRLRPGALQEKVASFLADHPNEAFTATKISRHLEHSSGAIANSLTTLTKNGIATQVSDSPRRYQYLPPHSGTQADASN